MGGGLQQIGKLIIFKMKGFVMKKKHFWIGFGVVLVGYLFWYNVMQTTHFRGHTKFFLDPKVDPAHKADAIKWEARSAYHRLMSPLRKKEWAEKAEAARLSNWKANFPFQPTHDPMVKLDSKVLNAEPNLEKRISGNWRFRRELHAGLHQNHRILKKFFEDDLRFSRQFEQFYNILKEHDRGHDPAQIVQTFHAFRRLWHSAVEHDPNDYRTQNGRKIRKSIFGFETWGDQAEQDYWHLQFELANWKWLRPRFESKAGKAEANGLIGRLLEEMEGMEELPIEVMDYETFGDLTPEESEEELLLPYVGWFEKARESRLEHYWRFDFQREFVRGFDNPSKWNHEKSLEYWRVFLNSKLNIKNNRLVDSDSKAVKPFEGMNLNLQTFFSDEKFPLTIDDEGFLTIPSPAEIDAMREMSKGDLQDAE